MATGKGIDKISKPAATQAWVAAAPGVFVLLWSTGFICAKLGAPYAEPFTFLFWRFVIAVVLFAAICLLFRAPWPSTRAEYGQAIIAGWLVHGVHLGGVFWAIEGGVPAGTTAIIVGIHPLLTAVLAGPYLGERVRARQWFGLVLGLVGIVLIVWDEIGLGGAPRIRFAGCVVALLGISCGTLYLKRHAESVDLRTASTVQLAAALLLIAPLSLALETGDISWNGEFIFVLLWLAVVLSVGTFTLLYFLIRRGAASRVVSLFYLVPPMVAVEAWILFGETITRTALAGMMLTVLAVAIVTRG